MSPTGNWYCRLQGHAQASTHMRHGGTQSWQPVAGKGGRHRTDGSFQFGVNIDMRVIDLNLLTLAYLCSATVALEEEKAAYSTLMMPPFSEATLAESSLSLRDVWIPPPISRAAAMNIFLAASFLSKMELMAPFAFDPLHIAPTPPISTGAGVNGILFLLDPISFLHVTDRRCRSPVCNTNA